MIRLSEALAKLSGSDEVLLQHVTEAAYLLKTSIVHVEQESVSMDEPLSGTADAMDEDEVALNEMDTDQEPKKKKITLTSQEYNKIFRSIILQIQRHERTSNEAGMTKTSIINWYLETMEQANSIDTEEAYLYQRKVVKSVLNRMVKDENTLLEMRDISRLDETEIEEASDDPILVINPAFCDE
jgi:DNA replication licensing factor MCM6